MSIERIIQNAGKALTKKADEVLVEETAAQFVDPIDPKIDMIKTLIANEYVSWWMYKAAVYKCRGEKRIDVIPEYEDHAKEEMDHAEQLEERLNVLGGLTFGNPGEWIAAAKVDIPSIDTTNIDTINAIILKAENTAVQLYKAAMDIFCDDEVTKHIIRDILEKEEEHVFDVKYNLMGQPA